LVIEDRVLGCPVPAAAAAAAAAPAAATGRAFVAPEALVADGGVAHSGGRPPRQLVAEEGDGSCARAHHREVGHSLRHYRAGLCSDGGAR
jgi:hypothetical protein